MLSRAGPRSRIAWVRSLRDLAQGLFRTPGRGIFHIVAALLLASCAPERPTAIPGAGQRLVDGLTPRERLRLRRSVTDETIYDFTSMTALEDLTVHDASCRLTPEGLVFTQKSAGSRLQFELPETRFNSIRIELSSSAVGRLTVEWTVARRPFDRSRSQVARVGRAHELESYTIDLSKELDGEARRYRVRIHPLDAPATVLIRKISFVYAAAVPASRSQAGKLEIEKELRQTILLPPGARIERKITGGPGLKLVFGLARLRDNPEPLRFQVSLLGKGKDLKLFEKTVGLDEAFRWQTHEVDLPDCPPGDCMLFLEVLPSESPGVAGALLVSNPVVVGRRKGGAPNVLLISLDTLGSRHLAAYGGPEEASPFLTEISQEGVVFENAFANSSLTDTSHASLLTGSAPFATPYYWLDGAVRGEVTLADRLRSNGYLTAAFTAGVLVSAENRFDKGFDTFYQHDTLYRPLTERTDIDALTDRALSWVEQYGHSPFFLFLHTYEAHGPYYFHQANRAPAGGKENGIGKGFYNSVNMRGALPVAWDRLADYVTTLNQAGQLLTLAEAGIELASSEALIDAYRGEIRFLDSAIQRFLKALQERGVLDNTVVVMTADHGEAFFEHGLVNHGILYDENLRVPLILWAPGRIPAGQRIPQSVSSMDIAPTILDLVDVPIPGEMEGSSLVPLIHGADEEDHDFYAFVPGNGLSWYSQGKYKLISRSSLDEQSFGKHELFDLSTDPLEQRNLLAEGKEIPGRLRRQMRQTIERFPGVHVDFGAFAGETYEIEILAPPRVLESRLYGFDVQRASWPGDEASYRAGEPEPESLRLVLTFSRRSRMVLRNKGKKLAFNLYPAAGRGDPLTFVLDGIANKTMGKTTVRADSGNPDKSVTVWRVGRALAGKKRLSPDEEEKLRALGYL